jgi:hypothetical protein
VAATNVPTADDWRALVSKWQATPSPLDGLEASSIPASERVAGQPEELVAVLGSHTGRPWGPVMRAVCSPDGRHTATLGRERVRLWRSDTLREVAVLDGWEGEAVDMAFAPDGASLVVVGGRGWMQVWSLREDSPLLQLTFQWKDQEPIAVAFSPDGTILAVALQESPPSGLGFDSFLQREDFLQREARSIRARPRSCEMRKGTSGCSRWKRRAARSTKPVAACWPQANVNAGRPAPTSSLNAVRRS